VEDAKSRDNVQLTQLMEMWVEVSVSRVQA
jgi:hypothetical protein